MTFVGYETNSKGYRFWDKATHTVVLSRDATFDETVFPHRPSPPPSDHSLPPATSLRDLLPSSPSPSPSSSDSDSDDDDGSSSSSSSSSSGSSSSPSLGAAPQPLPAPPVTPPSAPLPPPSRTRAQRTRTNLPSVPPPRWANLDPSDSTTGRSRACAELLTEPGPSRPRRTITRPARFDNSAYGTRPFTDIEQAPSDDDDIFATPGADPSLSALLSQAISRDPFTLQEALSSP